jgi:pimeloyl-ACP methyl ester carboxylesterase
MPDTVNHGLRISYDDAGQGEPAVLFLPGWCAPREMFTPLLPLVSRHRRALALDWRGHGQSSSSEGDFGLQQLADDAQAVLAAAGVHSTILFAVAHAGWVAIELRRRLGNMVGGIILLEWFVLGAPPPFRDALLGMQSPQRWQQVVADTFDRWLHGVTDPRLVRFVREGMGSFAFPMWARAAREISAAFDLCPRPLDALATLHTPVLHLYSQPEDAAFLEAQQEFASSNPWFSVKRLQAHSHFPMFEVPEDIAREVESFACSLP